MIVKECLGSGGLGDCFIISLKLREFASPYFYTHVDKGENRLKLADELLNKFAIPHKCMAVGDIKKWWVSNHFKYDKCFNVFSKGYIDIPKRPYHWEPCVDDGFNKPYNDDNIIKNEKIAVQLHGGGLKGPRGNRTQEVIDYVENNLNIDDVVWLGTDSTFKYEGGVNYSGKLSFSESLDVVASCSYFVGFNSVLLYWALYNRLDAYLFTDHQGHFDLRIHDEWKKHITYDI